jgi:hypothetical protein
MFDCRVHGRHQTVRSVIARVRAIRLIERHRRAWNPGDFMNLNTTGCDIYSDCLTCPLPVCQLEIEGGSRALLLAARDAAAHDLKRNGWETARVARFVGMSRRNAFRVLKA